MADKKTNDLDVGALGMGCGTSLLVGSLQFIILAALVTNSGVLTAQNVNAIPLEIRLVGLFSSQVINFLVGYVTANYASHSKMSHAAVISGVSLFFGLVGVAFNPMGQSVLNFISLLLLIPVTMLGAKVAVSRSSKESATSSD